MDWWWGMDWWWQFIGGAIIGLAAWLTWEVLRLRRLMHVDDLTKSAHWKKAIKGTRYTPAKPKDVIPEWAKQNELRFYREFQNVAGFLNQEYGQDPWSFQDSGTPGNGGGVGAS